MKYLEVNNREITIIVEKHREVIKLLCGEHFIKSKAEKVFKDILKQLKKL